MKISLKCQTWVSVYYGKAYQCYNNRQWIDVLVNADKAIELNDRVGRLYFFKGYACEQLGERNNALIYYFKGSQLDCYDAKQAYDRLNNMNPEYDVYCKEAFKCYCNNQWEDLIYYADKAIALNDKDGRIYFIRGFAHERQGSRKEAFDDYYKGKQMNNKEAERAYYRLRTIMDKK